MPGGARVRRLRHDLEDGLHAGEAAQGEHRLLLGHGAPAPQGDARQRLRRADLLHELPVVLRARHVRHGGDGGRADPRQVLGGLAQVRRHPHGLQEQGHAAALVQQRHHVRVDSDQQLDREDRGLHDVLALWPAPQQLHHEPQYLGHLTGQIGADLLVLLSRLVHDPDGGGRDGVREVSGVGDRASDDVGDACQAAQRMHHPHRA
mmetsp:Transcript_71926/g.201865  ORF Transcript_71926/g.201865 Transcript_71926/m.201865 type:complete len:205 (-) Transcript_71926:337-951(-)